MCVLPSHTARSNHRTLTAPPLELSTYHFTRIHESLRVTPAIELGLSKRIWSIKDLLGWASEFEDPLPDDPVPTAPRLRVVQGGKS